MPRQKLSLLQRNTWSRHADLYKEVFEYSLSELCKRKKLPEKEDDISALLLLILQTVCTEWSLKKEMEIPPPLAQLPSQNAGKAIESGMNSLPKPDFSCPKFSQSEGHNLYLDVECKLLGKPTSPSWILNKNYVTNGIKRFDSSSHKYGDQVTSGMMIGYIISMEPEDIVTEVNYYQQKYCNYPDLEFDFSDKVVDHEQLLQRKITLPKEFKLFHLWADLRK